MSRICNIPLNHLFPARFTGKVMILCWVVLSMMQTLAHPAQVHIKILVVVCQYADTETPELDSQQWADELNLGINTLYSSATHQQAPEFEFVPIPGVSKFDFAFASGEVSGEELTSLIDDPAVIDREGVKALKYARQHAPEYFSEPVYLLAIVNRSKEGRARALFDFPLSVEAQDDLKVRASISVMADPLAEHRFTFPSSISEEPDQDEDGLSDGFEAEKGTLPDRSDTDEDGYSDWAELALEISDPLDPVSKISLPDQTISKVAHLVGHQIGLPGLHPDDRYITDHSMGYWGLMSLDNSQGLSGFTRFHTQWIDKASGELVIEIGSEGLDEPLFYLVEPSFQFLGRFLPPGVFELVRIRRPSLPDILLEARPKFSVDASRIAEGFSRVGNISGLPSSYQPGVLVSQIDLGYDGQAYPYPGQYQKPVARVLPHEGENNLVNGQDPSGLSLTTLETATIQEQQIFRDAYGLEVHVGTFDRFEGSYEVNVKSSPLPSFSDLSVTDAWLDSAANGLGYFSFGMDEGSHVPRWGGDPVHLQERPEIRWIDSEPEVTLRGSPLEHQVIFQVQNIGSKETSGVKGSIYILPAFTLPIGDSMFDSEVLSSLAQVQQSVLVEPLNPGQRTEVSMSFYPEGSVQAFLILEQDSNELATHNNQYRSVFWTEYSTLETFYPSIEYTIHVYNGSPFEHHLVAQVSDVTEGWEESLTTLETGESKWSAKLNTGGLDAFQLHLKPPAPKDVSHGTIERVHFETRVDYADTDVPAGHLPLTVVLALPSKLVIDVVPGDSETLVSGVLSDESNEQVVLSEAVVSIEVVRSDGTRQTMLATTSTDGVFSFRLPNAPQTLHAGIVHFPGNASYASTQSDIFEWGQSDGPPIVPIRLSVTHLSGDGFIQLGVLNSLPSPLEMELQVSNDLVRWRKLDQKEIPSGESTWQLPFETTHQSTFFRMVNGEW